MSDTIKFPLAALEQLCNEIDTPETDRIVRNAATADHPPTRLAATLTVKCEKLERERDEAREAFVIATDQMVVAQCKLRESNKERDEAREVLRMIAVADWKTSGELRGMARRSLEGAK